MRLPGTNFTHQYLRAEQQTLNAFQMQKQAAQLRSCGATCGQIERKTKTFLHFIGTCWTWRPSFSFFFRRILILFPRGWWYIYMNFIVWRSGSWALRRLFAYQTGKDTAAAEGRSRSVLSFTHIFLQAPDFSELRLIPHGLPAPLCLCVCEAGNVFLFFFVFSFWQGERICMLMKYLSHLREDAYILARTERRFGSFGCKTDNNTLEGNWSRAHRVRAELTSYVVG